VKVSVGVRPSRAAALKRAGIPVPAPVPSLGLVDSAAGYTLIDAPVIQALGLTVPVHPMPIFSPSTGSAFFQLAGFNVTLTIVHPGGDPRQNLVLRSITVAEAQLSPYAALGIQVIIGCDVLAKCLFVYDGRSKLFSLAF
jgi:hypothetical protein